MTTTNKQKLLEKAREAQKHSYSPYSSFKVGSALVSETGLMYSGCNVENASYPHGQCAEATAIGNMVTDGEPLIREIMIVSPSEDFCPPCGGCRQKIAEFADADTMIHMATSKGDIKTVSVSELLPMAFNLKEQ